MIDRAARSGIARPLDAGRASRLRDAAPEMAVIRRDRVELADGRVACTLAVQGYPREVGSGWLATLLEFPAECRVAQHIEPIDTAAALAQLDRDLRAVRASELLAGLRGAMPDALDGAAASDAVALRAALARGDTRLFRHHLLITVFAADAAELRQRCGQLVALLEGRLLIARSCLLQQSAGFAATMPLGRLALGAARNLDSDALAAALPFGAGEFQSGDGELWGLDLRRSTPVIIDRFALPNPHLVVLGGSGSGKSFWMKHLLTQNLLAGRRAAVLDPQGEYVPWCRALGGETRRLCADGGPGWNPLDAPADAGNGAVERVRRATALLEILGGRPVDPAAVRAGLEEAARRSAGRPTQTGLAQALLAAGSGPAALGRRLQGALQGALRPFAGAGPAPGAAGPLTVFDLRDLVGAPSAVASSAYLLLAEHVLGDLAAPGGAPLTLGLDEAHHLLSEPVAARMVEVLFRTGRKRGVAMCLATQSVGDLLGAEARPDAVRAARAALANAAAVFLMRQQNARETGWLTGLYGLGPAEASWLLACRPGEGLAVAGPSRALVRVQAPEALRELFSTDPQAAARPP